MKPNSYSGLKKLLILIISAVPIMTTRDWLQKKTKNVLVHKANIIRGIIFE